MFKIKYLEKVKSAFRVSARGGSDILGKEIFLNKISRKSCERLYAGEQPLTKRWNRFSPKNSGRQLRGEVIGPQSRPGERSARRWQLSLSAQGGRWETVRWWSVTHEKMKIGFQKRISSASRVSARKGSDILGKEIFKKYLEKVGTSRFSQFSAKKLSSKVVTCYVPNRKW